MVGVAALLAAFSFALPFALNAKASDLDEYFWPAAELAAHGHPLLVYTITAGPNPNDNGPLALVPLTLVALLANALGWASNLQLRDALVLACFSGFILLAAHEAARVVAMAGGVRRDRAVYAAFCLSVPLWIAVGSFGHVEIALELWLTLVAFRLVLERRVAAGGLALGLVLLTRTNSVVALICMTLVAGADRQVPETLRKVTRSLTLLVVAALTTGVGLLPFFLGDRHDLITSMVTFRGALPIGGGSAWVLLARGLPWAWVVQDYDAALFSGAAAVLVAGSLWSTRSEPVTAARAAGLLATAACCVPLLAKSTWAYYLAEPYAFALTWALAIPGRVTLPRWAVPLLLTAASVLLTVAGPSAPPSTAQVVVGVAASAVIGWAMWLMLRRSSIDAVRPSHTRGQHEQDMTRKPPTLILTPAAFRRGQGAPHQT